MSHVPPKSATPLLSVCRQLFVILSLPATLPAQKGFGRGQVHAHHVIGSGGCAGRMDGKAAHDLTVYDASQLDTAMDRMMQQIGWPRAFPPLPPATPLALPIPSRYRRVP
ncbi:MAG: hypothetical protein C0494_02715 [Sphingobium sp.]|nr:hypothetical protein [Sphingobium sp.]